MERTWIPPKDWRVGLSLADDPLQECTHEQQVQQRVLRSAAGHLLRDFPLHSQAKLLQLQRQLQVEGLWDSRAGGW